MREISLSSDNVQPAKSVQVDEGERMRLRQIIIDQIFLKRLGRGHSLLTLPTRVPGSGVDTIAGLLPHTELGSPHNFLKLPDTGGN
jgi:hypothetical protein